MRRFALLSALFASCLCGEVWAQSFEPRAQAIERLLPGQSLRLHTGEGMVEGHFVTNRSDTLLLRQASARMSLSYADLDRIEVRDSARSRGIGLGMFVGSVVMASLATANDTEPLGPALGGVFVGGFLGGLIGGAVPRWKTVYAAQAPVDSVSRHR